MFRSWQSAFYEQPNVGQCSKYQRSWRQPGRDAKFTTFNRLLLHNSKHVERNSLITFTCDHIFKTPFKEQDESEKKRMTMTWSLRMNWTITDVRFMRKSLVAPVLPYEPQFAFSCTCTDTSTANEAQMTDNWWLKIKCSATDTRGDKFAVHLAF